MIRPGLERIVRLLHGIDLPWKAIHVAGTNGKGSVCAYLSAMLHDCNISTGRFTSPHLIDRWDCITINEKPVSESIFLEVEEKVKWRNNTDSIDATPFELLTATAFQIFNREKVKVGIVECGMGGRLDATNIFEKPLVTVITRLGMDHTAFLGDTEPKIAFEKAGIMKRGTPCVVDACSSDKFLRKITEVAAEKGVNLYFTPLPRDHLRAAVSSSGLSNEYYEMIENLPHKILSPQTNNMWCAYRAFALAMPRLNIHNKTFKDLVKVMDGAVMPGRYQRVDLSPLVARRELAILDGAHNPQSFNILIPWCRNIARRQDRLVVWVVAFSKGRDPEPFFRNIDPTNSVLIVEFGPVAGMPWVEPLPVAKYEPFIKDNPNWVHRGRDIFGALKHAAKLAEEGPLVITGSLYLVSDVLRMLRDAEKGSPAEKPLIRYVWKNANTERQKSRTPNNSLNRAQFMFEQRERLQLESDEGSPSGADDFLQPGTAGQTSLPHNVLRKFVAQGEPSKKAINAGNKEGP